MFSQKRNRTSQFVSRNGLKPSPLGKVPPQGADEVPAQKKKPLPAASLFLCLFLFPCAFLHLRNRAAGIEHRGDGRFRAIVCNFFKHLSIRRMLRCFRFCQNLYHRNFQQITPSTQCINIDRSCSILDSADLVWRQFHHRSDICLLITFLFARSFQPLSQNDTRYRHQHPPSTQEFTLL